MTKRILCVDDDLNVLEAYQRQLGKQFPIDVALGGEEALAIVADRGPYAVVVADMRMPGIGGMQLLRMIKEQAPDTVRMVLTGNADLQMALAAINEGYIFRLLTKPCPPDVLARALEAGIAQYELITAEHELLSQTLSGSIKVLTDILAMANPAAFGRASRVHRLASRICDALRLSKKWPIEVAAMLSQIGYVAVSEQTLAKIHRHDELSPGEKEAVANHPEVARKLLSNIPRLEEVAEIIAYQEKRYYGNGLPQNQVSGMEIPLGSRILKAAIDFSDMVSAGIDRAAALAEMRQRHGWYDPNVLGALEKAVDAAESHVNTLD